MNDAQRDRIASGLADTLLYALGYHRAEGCTCEACADGLKATASPDRAAMFDAYLKRVDKWTRRFQTILADVWAEERKVILANLKKLKGKAWAAKGDGLIDSILYPKRKFVEMLTEASRDLFKALMLDAGQTALDALDLNIAFDVTNPAVTAWLEEYTVKLSENLEFVNEDTLRTVLSQGMDAGETIPELMARVNDTFETWNRDRAEVIARTETIRASNQAALDSYKQSGVVHRKAWLASPESCEACQELEAYGPIAIDDEFFGDSYSDGQGPPLHPNCTCTIIPVVDD